MRRCFWGRDLLNKESYFFIVCCMNDTVSFMNMLRERSMVRFSENPEWNWDLLEKKLLEKSQVFDVLMRMEETGWEPSLARYDLSRGIYTFMDMSKESPSQRRNCCYDQEARISRKKFPPENSAWEQCALVGCEMLDRADYDYLQTLGEFDLKTSSWILTPEYIRKLGWAVFGDRRYDTVFFYHNGADSYYGARGWRGKIILM